MLQTCSPVLSCRFIFKLSTESRTQDLKIFFQEWQMCNDFNTCIRNRKYFGKNESTNKLTDLRMTHFFFSVSHGGGVGLHVPLDSIWGRTGNFYKIIARSQEGLSAVCLWERGTTSYRNLTQSIPAFLSTVLSSSQLLGKMHWFNINFLVQALC